MFPGLTDDDQTTVIEAVRAVVGRHARPPPSDERLAADRRASGARRVDRARGDGSQPPAAAERPRGRRARGDLGSAARDARVGARDDRRQGLRRAAGDARERRPRRRGHRLPDDDPPRARARRGRARHRGARREAARGDAGRGRRPRRGLGARPACRSRSATSSASTRPSWSSAGCWTQGWLSTVYAITSRRAGPFPARIRDVGRDHRSRDPRRRHPLVRRRRAADPRLGRDRPARPPGPRGPAVRAAVVPVGLGRDARRRLADAGQAPDADRGRRGGHVRARLPHPAPDLHALHRHDEPAPDPRLRADVRGRIGRAAAGERGAAGRRARRVPDRRPRGRSAGRQRRGRALGGGRRGCAAARGARAPDGRARRGPGR